MLRNFNAIRKNILNLNLGKKSRPLSLKMSSDSKVTLADHNALYKLKVASTELINHDVVKYVVELPSKEHVLGTKSGQHFVLIETIKGEQVMRKYTPLDLEGHKGTFEMIIKIYRPNSHPAFPDGGIMTPYLENLKPGDYITIKGPIGRCIYNHNGC